MRYYIHYTTGEATHHHYPYTQKAFAKLTGLTTAAIREALKQHSYAEGFAIGARRAMRVVLSTSPTQ